MEVPQEFEPFADIALTFSGGGFRAASFGLGVLSYLNQLSVVKGGHRKPLLHNVRYITAASGGSIPALLYATYNVRNRPFSEFYYKLYSVLQERCLLTKALQILTDDTEWEHTVKRQNPINAFAKAYDQLLFEGARVGDTISTVGLNDSSNSHLREVSIASTELHNGQLFAHRIRTFPKKDSENQGIRKAHDVFLYGNKALSLNKKTPVGCSPTDNIVGRIKLADIVAASSCFPGVFEPIIFPRDFTHDDLLEKELASIIQVSPHKTAGTDEYGKKQAEEGKAIQFGLMDGGIMDNQGLTSVLDFFREIRKDRGKYDVGIVLMNDVGSPFIRPYRPVQKLLPLWMRSLTLRSAGLWVGTTSTLLIIAAIGLSVTGNAGMIAGAAIIGFLGGLLCCTLLLKQTILFLGRFLGNRSAVSQSQAVFNKELIKSILKKIFSTRIEVMLRMVSERISSVTLLTGSLFLKRIRSILYEGIYASNKLYGKVVSNYLYELAPVNAQMRRHVVASPGYDSNQINGKLQNFLHPSEALVACSQQAFSMGTTLWFENGKDLRKEIISCGHYTTCYNLLLYIYRLETSTCFSFSAESRALLNDLRKQLETDYTKFKDNPYWLFEV